MRWAVLALCAGCNDVYGLEATRLADAEITSMTCPPIGTAPIFSRVVEQRLVQDCENLSLGGGRAVGTCNGTAFGIFEGAFDGTPLAEVENTDGFRNPRISPDGDTIFALDPSTGHMQLERTAGGWNRTVLPLPLGDSETHLTEPSSTSPRHVLLVEPTQIREYVDEAGTWVERLPATPIAFDDSLRSAHLSPDGLRFTGVLYRSFEGRSFVYAARTSVDEPFPAPLRVDVPLSYTTPVLTADCARLYFSALGFVLSVEQLAP